MRAFVAAFGLVVAGSACTSSLGSARHDFQTGHYGDAREKLEKLEPASKQWSEKERASYALYRGLTHHALGDRPRAVLWLREAKRFEDAEPSTFSNDDRTRLGLALESLGPDANMPQ